MDQKKNERSEDLKLHTFKEHLQSHSKISKESMQEQQVRARFEKLSIDPLSKALLYSEKRASM